jgi:hypothetical protein
MRTLKSLLLILALVVGVATTKGQNAETTHGAFYFLNGFQFFNFTNFNEKISSSDYPLLKANFGSGFGGYGEHKGWIFGGEGLYLQCSKSNGTKTSHSTGGLGYFFAGKNILNNKHWKLFPATGIGMGGVTSSLITEVIDGTSFDDIINNQPNSAVFNMGSVFLNSAISIEYKFRSRYFVGLKGGYNFSLLGPAAWSAPGLDESLSVKDPFGGLYLNAQIGFYLQ